MDLTEPETQAEHCSLCGELPDDLTVNPEREQDFPAAFYKLTPVGLSCPDQGQLVGAQFRRCPNCSMYFDWCDYPQIYGSGNCAEEGLTRLPASAARLLNKLFAPNPKAPPEAGDVDEYFEARPVDLLLPSYPKIEVSDMSKAFPLYTTVESLFQRFVMRTGQLEVLHVRLN